MEATHITHCCFIHGCKYGHEDCVVRNGEKQQEYPCEECPADEADAKRRIFDAESAYHRAWREYDFYQTITSKQED